MMRRAVQKAMNEYDVRSAREQIIAKRGDDSDDVVDDSLCY